MYPQILFTNTLNSGNAKFWIIVLGESSQINICQLELQMAVHQSRSVALQYFLTWYELTLIKSIAVLVLFSQSIRLML